MLQLFSLSIVIFLCRYKSDFILPNKTARNFSGLTITLLSLNQFMTQLLSDLKCLQVNLQSWQSLAKYYHCRNYEETHYTEKKKKTLKKTLYKTGPTTDSCDMLVVTV